MGNSPTSPTTDSQASTSDGDGDGTSGPVIAGIVVAVVVVVVVAIAVVMRRRKDTGYSPTAESKDQTAMYTNPVYDNNHHGLARTATGRSRSIDKSFKADEISQGFEAEEAHYDKPDFGSDVPEVMYTDMNSKILINLI